MLKILKALRKQIFKALGGEIVGDKMPMIIFREGGSMVFPPGTTLTNLNIFNLEFERLEDGSARIAAKTKNGQPLKILPEKTFEQVVKELDDEALEKIKGAQS